MLPADYGLVEYEVEDRTNQRTFSARKISTDRGLPENTEYADTGCELAPSCLECPLALCKYDDPDLLMRSNKVMRDTEILRLYSSGVKVSKIAVIVNTSERTVYRIIQRDIGSTHRVRANSHPRRRSLPSTHAVRSRRRQSRPLQMP